MRLKQPLTLQTYGARRLVYVAALEGAAVIFIARPPLPHWFLASFPVSLVGGPGNEAIYQPTPLTCAMPTELVGDESDYTERMRSHTHAQTHRLDTAREGACPSLPPPPAS